MSDKQTGKQFTSFSHASAGHFVSAAIDEVSYELTPSNIKRAREETPTLASIDALESAEKANAFLASPGSPNPFASLSGEQLSTLFTDSSGTFTLNERRAAYTESFRREQVWRVEVAAQAMQEYNASGKLTNFFDSVLKHFQALSPLEQSLYPDGYALDLREKIDLDFNYFTGVPGGGGETRPSGIGKQDASSAIQQALEANNRSNQPKPRIPL